MSANVMLAYGTSLPSLKATDLNHEAMVTQHLDGLCYNLVIKSDTLLDSNQVIIICIKNKRRELSQQNCVACSLYQCNCTRINT